MKAYHIKLWNSLYETAETRKIRTLTYYAKPNKLIGEGIGHTLAQADGLALLGTWALIESLASTAAQEHRGWLVRNGSALDAARLANLARVPAVHFERALSFFATAPMDWLEQLEWQDTPPLRPSKHADNRDTTGRPLAESPGDNPEHADNRDTTRPISPRGKIEGRGKTDVLKEREENGGFASKEAAATAQSRQFAAVQSRIKDLEAIPSDDRSVAQDEDLKKNRATLKAIQKKQRGGDFTPVKEGK